MPVKLFITIDTEEDSWDDYWSSSQSLDNVARIPVIQSLFDRYGAVPTYLVSYPVVKNEPASRILLDLYDKGRCEIGAHCHPWSTPPYVEEKKIVNTMLSNLPYKILRDKIEMLHKAIVDKFKVCPICFRAGRWGFDSEVARAIYELGYQIDTSVTPCTDWTDHFGPNFWEAPSLPYRFNPANILVSSLNGYLLEIPPTVGFLQNNSRLCSRILKWLLHSRLSRLRVIGILDRLRILNRRWLSPETRYGHEMILLAKTLIQKGYKHLNMTFHSTSLLPGKSPFVRDENELRIFLNNIEVFLQFAQKHNIVFAPLREGLEIINKT